MPSDWNTKASAWASRRTTVQSGRSTALASLKSDYSVVHPGSNRTSRATVAPMQRAISREADPAPPMKLIQAKEHIAEEVGEDEVEASDEEGSTEEDDDEESDSEGESDDGDSSEEDEGKPEAKTSMPFRLKTSCRPPQAPPVVPWFEVGQKHLIELAQVNKELDLAKAAAIAMEELQSSGTTRSMEDPQVRRGVNSLVANQEERIEKLEKNATSVRNMGKLGIMFSRLPIDEATSKPPSNWASIVGPLHCDEWYDCEAMLQRPQGADPTFHENTKRHMQRLPGPPPNEASNILRDNWEEMKTILLRARFQMPTFKDRNGQSFQPDWTRWTKDDAGSIANYFPFMFPILDAHRSAFIRNYPQRLTTPRSRNSAAPQPSASTYNQPTHYPPMTQESRFPSARQWTPPADLPNNHRPESGLRQDRYAPGHAQPRHRSRESYLRQEPSEGYRSDEDDRSYAATPYPREMRGRRGTLPRY